MAALKPEDCDNLIFEAINNKDLEAGIALYEPNATFIVLETGEVLNGQAAIRETLKGWMELEDAKFSSLKAFVNEKEGLALLRGTWSAISKGPDGKPTKISGKNVEVVRRQPDGTWRFVIDHPIGAD